MEINEFRKYSHEIVDWIADFFEKIRDEKVTPDVRPGDVLNKLPSYPPRQGEPFEKIMEDFNDLIKPAMTHWQHPRFHGYFPANNSFPSILGEMLTSALGAQCMMWQTSPAAAELEELVLNWLAQMTGIPESWYGVIQDTASTATLCSILTAREVKTKYNINKSGFQSKTRFRIYCSSEAHSSIEKAAKIAGIGKNNVIKIKVDNEFRMDTEHLEESIRSDIDSGFIPLCVVGALGTTGSTAVDPLDEIGEIAEKYNVWFHIDAAYAGSAMILPERRKFLKEIERADSYVFNPHKWMFTNFDCSAYYVKDKGALIRTFEIMPEYLKTRVDSKVNNYRDWGIQLGRRFRALKLWFVIRSYGLNGLQEKLRHHIKLSEKIRDRINEHPDLELLAPVNFSTICFRYIPDKNSSPEDINEFNENLLKKLNSTGRAFFSHTKLDGKYTIRFVIAQTNVTEEDVEESWDLILKTAEEMK